MKPTTILTTFATMAITVSNVTAFPTVMNRKTSLSTRGQDRIPEGAVINSMDTATVDAPILPHILPHGEVTPALQKRHCKIHWTKNKFCTPDGHKRDLTANEVEVDNVEIPGLHDIPGLSPTPNEAGLSNEDAGHQYINVMMAQLEPIVREKSFAMEAKGFHTTPCIDSCHDDAYSRECRNCATVFMNVMRYGMEAL
ncbi:hypothetical protein LTR85_002881 [Meristemomyces frigidus]|nr:hypothetical protein LTR85_002881 [Meristemomyces frigidus]